MESPPIPKWFLRDLEIIDPTYYLEWSWHSFGWYIRRRFQIMKKGVFVNNPRIGFYRQWEPDGRILEDLRFRKQEGLRLNLDRNPNKYLKEIVGRNKEAKRKAREANFEFMTDGLMFGHRLATRKTFI